MSEKETPETMEEEYEPQAAQQRKWAEFVETTVIDFFSGCKLEKMSIEDGKGNKAKIALMKDNGIKLEYSTSKLL